MLERLSASCESCDRPLNDEKQVITFERNGCIRHVYECSCRAVTITVSRD
ncbi:MAG: hypothetical protein IH933_16365 [Euryarchaeota archaeon]|jgi:hypothetical protein|nr:hypothetical protein [Euryarchaeota archaeon]